MVGLKLAGSLHCNSLFLDFDSEVLVKMMNKGVQELHPLYSVLNICKFLKINISICKFSHCYREINMVTDSLSKSNLGSEFEVQYFQQPTTQVVEATFHDLCNSIKFRTVIVS